MITYLGMTMPMAVLALIAWLRHPYQGNRSEVQVNRVKGKEWLLLSVLTVFVTAGFCFLLQYFHTANLIPSTVSVATGFAAAYSQLQFWSFLCSFSISIFAYPTIFREEAVILLLYKSKTLCYNIVSDC